MKKLTPTPAATATPSTTSKPGRKPHTDKDEVKAADPTLAAEWAHLRAWWKKHNDLYNVKSIAARANMTNLMVTALLNGPETDPAKIKKNAEKKTQRSYAATREKLTALKNILALHYQEEGF